MNENLKNPKDRVIQELNEVNDRRAKLSMFIKSDKFTLLSDKQKELLKVQNHYMEMYAHTLSLRLEIWDK